MNYKKIATASGADNGVRGRPAWPRMMRDDTPSLFASFEGDILCSLVADDGVPPESAGSVLVSIAGGRRRRHISRE